MNNEDAIVELKIIRDVYADMRKEYKTCVEALDMAIKALSVEPKKGRWVLSGGKYTCSVCGKKIITNKELIKEHKWCFGCGADMREEE